MQYPILLNIVASEIYNYWIKQWF